MQRTTVSLRTRLLLPALIASAGLLGCRGAEVGAGIADAGDEDDDIGETSGDDMGDSGGGELPRALLSCPQPGNLPFELASEGFDNADSDTLVAENPRFKDEGTDMLGNPGGPYAHTRMPVTANVADNLDVFVGVRARTTNSEGLVTKPIVNEWVSLWQFDQSAETWAEAARLRTDDAGLYSVSTVTPNDDPGQPVYAILEGDGTCVAHYSYLLEPGAKFVVTDIDGTLTLDDQELFTQIANGEYVPQENGSAQRLLSLWAEKGYEIVYLTARPHQFRAESRKWLDDLGYPPGPMISANNLVFGQSAREYKGAWIRRLTQDFGWNVVAAYGNADSDVQAYEDGGIPKNITFIIGPEAGSFETQPILDNDFSAHIEEFVEPYPNAN
jgi:hypothetical protein